MRTILQKAQNPSSITQNRVNFLRNGPLKIKFCQLKGLVNTIVRIQSELTQNPKTYYKINDSSKIVSKLFLL